MASVVPAMRGKFGSTEFYIVTMNAKELTERLVVPSEIESWGDLSIEERYQREIDYKRVKNQIAPYLVEDVDRFFGAFIVSMMNAEETEFEPITQIYKGNVPNLYQQAGSAFGFLTLQGGEIMVPLDGQHRLAALEFAITGKDEKKQPISSNFQPKAEVAEDVCTVILIKHDSAKSRKIFNKVNRYAKRTSKAENLITADDDVVAVIVRESIIGTDNYIPDVLVNAKSNTLTVKSGQFTTLSNLYESTKYLLEDTHGRINTEQLPSSAVQATMRDEAEEFWATVCDEVTLFRDALHNPGEAGNKKRIEIRKDYVLGKPVAQWALVQAIVRLRQENSDNGSRLSLTEACKRVNELNWAVKDPRWQGVLMSGERMLSGKTAVNYASQIVAYWLGVDITDTQLMELEKRYADQGNAGGLAQPLYPM